MSEKSDADRAEEAARRAEKAARDAEKLVEKAERGGSLTGSGAPDPIEHADSGRGDAGDGPGQLKP
jgi:general stress protein YciG